MSMISPALDALRELGSASPGSGMRPNSHRLTEAPSPKIPDNILAQLRMAHRPKAPAAQQPGAEGPKTDG